MPRTLYLLTRYPCWSETFLRQDLALLLEQSTDVLLPVALYSGDCERQPDWPAVKCLSSETVVDGCEATCGKAIQLIKRLPLPRRLYSALSQWHHRNLLLALNETVRENAITHIHVEFADLAAILARAVAKKCGLTYSVGIHAFDIHASRHDLTGIFRDASRIVVCNRAAHNALLARFPETANKTTLIPHGVLLQNWPFSSKPKLPSETHPPRLVAIGRFVPKKGFNILLTSLKLLHNRGILASLTLVGDGPLAESLYHQAYSLGLETKVVFHGVCSHADVLRVMQEHDVLVVPSIVSPNGDRDGIPNVLLEAMAAGIPVIGTRAGSLTEVLSEETGWLCEPESPAALADAIQAALNATPEERLRRCSAARQIIETQFDAKALAQQRANILFHH